MNNWRSRRRGKEEEKIKSEPTRQWCGRKWWIKKSETERYKRVEVRVPKACMVCVASPVSLPRFWFTELEGAKRIYVL